jgi:hypothetical protein
LGNIDIHIVLVGMDLQFVLAYFDNHRLYCPISGQGKIDNTNNVYQEMQHLRKVQGANLYMTNNMLQSKTNSKSKHLPPNNWDILNDDNVLEEYYKKYPTQREVTLFVLYIFPCPKIGQY